MQGPNMPKLNADRLDMVDILKAGSRSVGPRFRFRVWMLLLRPLGIELSGHQQTHLPRTWGSVVRPCLASHWHLPLKPHCWADSSSPEGQPAAVCLPCVHAH